jgi:hypothetical protein
MTGAAYRIRDWRQRFETPESRKCKALNWVAVPNKHDGLGYRRLLRTPDGPAIYGAWVAILAVASKCPTRGVLADEAGPLSAADISLKCDFPEELIARALGVLSSAEIGWLERPDASTNVAEPEPAHARPVVCQGRSSVTPVSCQEKTPSTLQDMTGQTLQTDSSEPSQTTTAEPDAAKANGEPDQKPRSPPPAAAVLEFPIVGSKVTTWSLTAAKLAEYESTYPGMDVLAECRKAAQWCRDNPGRRKTAIGMAKFLGNWLSKANDAGHSRRAVHHTNAPGSSQSDVSSETTAHRMPSVTLDGPLSDRRSVLKWFRKMALKLGLSATRPDEIGALVIAAECAGRVDGPAAFVAELRAAGARPELTRWQSQPEDERAKSCEWYQTELDASRNQGGSHHAA